MENNLTKLLEQHLYEKDDNTYCKYCNCIVDVDYSEVKEEDNPYTDYKWEYSCYCKDFKKLNPIILKYRK